jgi:hypothetical protein
VKKPAASPPKRSRVKQHASKPTGASVAKEQGSAKKATTSPVTLLELVHQLQTQAAYADLKASRSAFEALTQMLHEVFAWLHTIAALHPQSLAALLRRLPQGDAWARYEGGEHAGAWAGVELARLYRHIHAELRSRSKHSVNRLRDIRYGFAVGEFAVPANAWFCAEYDRKADYRPTGKMAVWTARKIEELRHIKESRSERRQYASIEILEGRLRLRAENETDAVLADWFRSDLVEGEGLKQLDNLPGFGSPNAEDFESWRKFVRRRLLREKVIGEFDVLFPNSRRKLDGVIAATLRCAWQTVHRGGNVILPQM